MILQETPGELHTPSLHRVTAVVSHDLRVLVVNNIVARSELMYIDYSCGVSLANSTLLVKGYTKDVLCSPPFFVNYISKHVFGCAVSKVELKK